MLSQLVIKIFICLIIISSNCNTQVPQIFPNFPAKYDTGQSNPRYAEGLPIAADFRGNGSTEVAIGTSINFGILPRIYLIDLSGNILPGWPRVFSDSTGNSYILGTAAGDVNDDSKVDVVIQTKDSIYVIDYMGSNLPGFPVYFPQSSNGYVFPFTLALYDIEGNGELNIIAGAGNNIAVFNRDGSIKQGWPISLSPVPLNIKGISVGDLDGDKKAEIIALSGCEQWQGCDLYYIHVFDRNGDYFPGWPVHSDSMYVTGRSAVVLQLDSLNSANSSLYICTSINAPSLSDSVRSRITIYDTHGNIRRRWYLFDDYIYTPIIADLNTDNENELFTGEQSWNQFLFTLNGTLLPGWPRYGSDAYNCQSCIGKIKYGNQLFVVSPLQSAFFDTNNVLRGRVHAYDYSGVEADNWPLKPMFLVTGMAFSDINSDGSVEIMTSGTSGDTAVLNVYTIPGIPFTKENFPWRMFAHDRYRTNQLGFIPPDEPIGIKPISQNIPGKFTLYQNYPNPFNPSTTIKFDIPVKSDVRFEIFDVTGKLVSHSDYTALQI